MKVWLVECREESNYKTGERKGAWYPCGYIKHRTKREALTEARGFGSSRKYRVVEYVRKRVNP
jgi:hypothetical protein